MITPAAILDISEWCFPKAEKKITSIGVKNGDQSDPEACQNGETKLLIASFIKFYYYTNDYFCCYDSEDF